MAPPLEPQYHRLATGRPVIKSMKTSTHKHQREFNTYAKKLHIINWRVQHSMESAIDTFFNGVTGNERQTVWKRILRWEAQRAHITRAANQPSTSQKRTTCQPGTATTLSYSDEENIALWVAELRQDGVPVSNLLLQCKALEIAADLGLSKDQFKSSPTWIKSFMKRWGLAIRVKTRSGQANLEDGQQALAEFKTSIRQIILDNDIEDIYNADQTGINYEYIPKQTINKEGAKTVWMKCSGHEKDRMTAMLLADAKGAKYPLFLVLKTQASKIKSVVQENLTQRNGFGRRVWNEITDLHDNFPLRIYGSPSAWWNSDISLHFLGYHFGHRRGTSAKYVLLLWDDYSAHFTENVSVRAEELRVLLSRVPPTFTWMCQSADVAWMKPIKALMRRKWVEFLRTQIAENHGGGGKAFWLGSPDRWDLVEWISDAWNTLPTSTVIKGFVKCQIIDPPGNAVETCDFFAEDIVTGQILQTVVDSGEFEVVEMAEDLPEEVLQDA
ncbi:hypothetical protein DYB26_006247 [Aphanomyces astaci]|uniref:HTH CENPB-type domain-containing protein n=1 Tax=Aphanomyces astaci TaxID=112090 RepID=A0A397F0J0_APHAT|nr:hypothetical protein DYB38_003010 [Aphanomyces astaci]RHZ10864.1 hypothetical protein DYB31_002711 [Aphanomyces astaci]RHZ33262.1 hypothetical protein DYB26_006247 [Aphanomyces astaci]